jgi:hypothetical protein
MLRLLVLGLLALPALCLGGCADSLSGTTPAAPSFAASAKSYDKTLTPDQRKAAIAELQQAEQAKRQVAGQDDAAPAPKPAQAQN